MSSGPVGLDAREYAYGMRTFTQDDPNVIYTTEGVWLLTRIQVFAPEATPAALEISNSRTITIAPGGCACLEPNGGYRGVVRVGGVGALVIFEYWFQASGGSEVVPVLAAAFSGVLTP